MNDTIVANLDSIDDHELALVGPKAASLVRLTRLGLAVSPGFCVFAGAYRAHLEAVAPGSKLDRSIDELSNASTGDVAHRLEDIRNAIVKAKMTSALLEAIDEHYAALNSNRLAVRSSATAEDLPGHSFAGQHDTYLGVSGFDDCVRRIKECWASIWTERAYAYRKKNGFDHNAVDMGVIVQALVPAETSGVLFTADPVTGDKDRVVIEACWGLGEVLVSGKVAPDRYVLASDDFRILEHAIAEKSIELAVTEEDGAAERPINSERRGTSCLSEAQARQLAASACRVAAAEGCPQDVEWSVCGGEIVFHQARSISVAAPKRSWASRQVWINANVGEVLPDVVTPLTWYMMDSLFDALLRDFYRWMGIELGDHPIVGRVAGRAYFNLNMAVGVIRRMPVLRTADLTKVLGGDQDRAFQAGDLDIADEDIPDVKVRLWKMFMKMPWFAFQALRHSPKNGARFARRLNEQIETLKHTDPRELSISELADFVQHRFDELHEVVEGIGFACSCIAYVAILEKICVRWLDDKERTANRLLSGMGGMDSAEAGLAMWKLAQLAGSHADLAALTERAENWEAFRTAVDDVEGGRDFLEQWRDFMTQHGHHTRGELEFANPRWAERPDYVLDRLRGYVRGLQDVDPVAAHAERGREREALIQECRGKLRNPVKRLLFNHFLSQAQKGSIVRENIKSAAVRYLAVIREFALELGNRLVTAGKFREAGDIFFLELAEIVPAAESEFAAAETIAKRHEEYESNLKFNPPSIVVGEYDPINHPEQPVSLEGDYLEGIAVSPGIVRGPARVILRADENDQVLPGEILVAPFTDPGWTPYFIPAAGIVMDLGGQLSHGSIIAREYGIPAVVNVGPATRLIKTGQLIEVDGNRGRVRLSDG